MSADDTLRKMIRENLSAAHESLVLAADQIHKALGADIDEIDDTDLLATLVDATSSLKTSGYPGGAQMVGMIVEITATKAAEA